MKSNELILTSFLKIFKTYKGIISMSKEKDFEYVVGKIPIKDKKGNDITKDKLGKGGFHRKDGTYSGVVYDLKRVSKDPTKPNNNPTEPSSPPMGPMKEQKVKGGVKDKVVDMVAEAAVDLAVDLVKKGISEGFGFLKRKITRHKETINNSNQTEDCNSDTKITVEMRRFTEVSPSPEANEPDPIDVACENYTVNMTSEDAQKELLDAFILRLLSERKLWKLSHAKVTDSEGNITDVHAMIDKLTDPQLLNSINNILSNNIELLEAWQMTALKDILARELIQNGDYIPIESESFKKILTST